MFSSLDFSSPLTLLTLILSLLAFPFAVTYLITTLQFHISLYRHRHSSTPTPPPTLPYTIPFLAHSLSFTNRKPGVFLEQLRPTLSRYNLSVITIRLLGQPKAHILSSPAAVQALFKAKNVSREKFNHEVVMKAMGVPVEDARKVYDRLPDGTKGYVTRKEAERWEEMSSGTFREYLLKDKAVHELTAKFVELFTEVVKEEGGVEREGKEVRLVAWIKWKMFRASTTALFGNKIMKTSPEFANTYWDFDEKVMTRMFGLPKWTDRRAYDSMDELLDCFEAWVRDMREAYGVNGPGTDDEWNKEFGSRVVRARHELFGKQGISDRAAGAYHQGFLFGLSSNAVPTVCWMLCHLLSPGSEKLLASLLEELKTVQRADGTIDLVSLLSLPVLQSVFQETLRLYTDTIVARILHSDLVIDNYLLRSGEVAFAPSWLGHRNSAAWEDDGGMLSEKWCGERFLREDEKTGKTVFSAADTAGRFFPFGGGGQICPGRVFAKQEVFAAVAVFLLEYDVDFESFIETDGRDELPGTTRNTRMFPTIAEQFGGNTVMTMEGDLLVRLRRRPS